MLTSHLSLSKEVSGSFEASLQVCIKSAQVKFEICLVVSFQQRTICSCAVRVKLAEDATPVKSLPRGQVYIPYLYILLTGRMR